ncbi:DUF1330 domain-containing protein [Fretibacter rubidus]|uniref:DUF1330 domain-containing protein n=1 Tax=Fretibacter rubidus TaxID=570162 RepID=UPI003529F953
MATLNELDPTPEQIKAFLGHAKAGQPVFMLNLLKFKDRATYKDGQSNPDNDISGREAYNRYASAFAQMVKDSSIDGGAVFGGAANAMLIGTGDEWDAVAIFEYPDAQTMFDTVSSDAYRKIHKHRRAGLAGQLLISCDNSGVF